MRAVMLVTPIHIAITHMRTTGITTTRWIMMPITGSAVIIRGIRPTAAVIRMSTAVPRRLSRQASPCRFSEHVRARSLPVSIQLFRRAGRQRLP